MAIAKRAKDGIIILSKKKIHKHKGKLITASEFNKKAKKLEDIISCPSGAEFIAQKDYLYRIDDNFSKVKKNRQKISESAVEAYKKNPDFDYAGFMRNGRCIVIEDTYDLKQMLSKATNESLPWLSRRALIKKIDDYLANHLSINPFFKERRSTSILKKAQKLPEKSLHSRVAGSLGIIAKKSYGSLTKRKYIVQKELDRMFFCDKRQDIMLSLSTNNLYKKTEIADSLAASIGAYEYFVLKHIPFIAVPCSAKDIDKICASINTGTAYLGKIQSYQHIRKARRSSGIYMPELFTRTAKEMGLPAFDLFSQHKEQGWNLNNIKAPLAWKDTKGQGASVLIIDTGVDYNHPELASRFTEKKGYNFVSGDKRPLDDNGHGTHVAGIVAGISTGVAPYASLQAAKVLDRNGSGSNTDVIRAIDYALSNKDIDIINMSLGSSYYSHALDRICKKAYQDGLIICAAAGNESYGAEYPAACSGVISVAALDSENKHAKFSNIHKSVDISCPGVRIHSTYPKGGYKILSGTSMASPHCAGVAALAVSVRQNTDSRDFEKSMYATAKVLGAGEPYQKEKYGQGIPQCNRMIDLIRDKNQWRLVLWK